MSDREQEQQQHLLELVRVSLLEAESIPVFEEATQTAAHYLEVPICILGLMDGEYQRFKAAVGLSRLGLMNELATKRILPRTESFCDRVVESCKTIAISDISADPAMSHSRLFEHYGVIAYLGVPLIISSGQCLGTLAVMDLVPRTFTSKEIQYLEIVARWSISEFERNSLLTAKVREEIVKGKQDRALERQETPKIESVDNSQKIQPVVEVKSPIADPSPLKVSEGDKKREVSDQFYRRATDRVKTQLLNQLTEELRTPLTSVMGMASVLIRETYGPLISKQKEYLNIIYHSGQYLLSLVNEILELGTIDDINQELTLASVDVEMLCQQALGSLEHLAKRQNQEIRVSVEPGNRIWLLDKLVVRHIIYHLVSSVMQSATPESVVRIHLSRKGDRLNIAIWVSHPWLGEGLPDAELESYQTALPERSDRQPLRHNAQKPLQWQPDISQAEIADFGIDSDETISDSQLGEQARNETIEQLDLSEVAGTIDSLRILLSRQLVQIHRGKLSIQGSMESGYRYVVNLPDLTDRRVN